MGSVAAACVCGSLPAGATAPLALPDLALPAAPVAPPVVPGLPAVPVPAPPAVQIPVSAPPASAIPPPASLPPIPATGASVGGQLRDVVGEPRQDGRAAATGRKRAGHPGVAGTGYRKPRRLVRALRGCLDELSPRGSKLLILRYGIGGLHPLPAARVARRLDMSARRYRLARRHALRRLVHLNRTTRCRHSGMGVSAFTFVASQQAMRASATAEAGLAAPAGVTGARRDARDEVRVLGEFAEGGDSLVRKAEPSDLGLPLADERDRNAYLLGVGAVLAVLAAWLVARRRRSAETGPPAT